VEIPEHLLKTRTERAEDFVLADTGADDAERIIMFGSPTDVERLSSCSSWLADGTFKAAPSLWYQLWVIHGLYANRTVPLIYVLLPDKKESSYKRAIGLLIEKIDVVNSG
jgi:hypothetical protein